MNTNSNKNNDIYITNIPNNFYLVDGYNLRDRLQIYLQECLEWNGINENIQFLICPKVHPKSKTRYGFLRMFNSECYDRVIKCLNLITFECNTLKVEHNPFETDEFRILKKKSSYQFQVDDLIRKLEHSNVKNDYLSQENLKLKKKVKEIISENNNLKEEIAQCNHLKYCLERSIENLFMIISEMKK